MWRITNHRKQLNHLRASLIERLLNMVMIIGIPKTEEEAAQLEKIYDAYQNIASEIEGNMKRVCDKIYDWRKLS